MEGRTEHSEEHACAHEMNESKEYSDCEAAIDIEPKIERCVSRSAEWL
jgi:hypothetical protein